jgi:hypothetical protein
MKIITLYLLLTAASLRAQDTQPARTPMEKAMVEAHMKEASANFATACINLNRDIQEKRLTIYSVETAAKSCVTNLSDFTVQTIYHPELSQNYEKVSGSYMAHYNSCLLDFALAQYADGKKALGIGLVRLLSQAEPELEWSSARISSIPVKSILASLEADDRSLTPMLKEASGDWRQREKDYNPRK